MMEGHRQPKKMVVTNIAKTPIIERGASASNDRKLQSGKITMVVMSSIHIYRAAASPDKPTD